MIKYISNTPKLKKIKKIEKRKPKGQKLIIKSSISFITKKIYLKKWKKILSYLKTLFID